MATLMRTVFYVSMFIWVLVFHLVHCQDMSPSAEEYAEMEKYLATMNKPAVKTFMTEHGDIFDCVDINKQPAFDNPLLKDHKIQLRPSSLPVGMQNKSSSSSFIAMKIGLPEEGCPPGTVPIRRIRMEELLRAGSVANHRSKYGRAAHEPLSNEGFVHQHAVLRLDGGGPYYGTAVGLNLWNPNINTANGEIFSLAQFWIVNDSSDTNTIEGGWHVRPEMYGNDATHLFIYWTANGYRTGCHNLECGFVQVDQRIMPGLSFPQISSYEGIQPGVVLTVIRDTDGNWWLGFEEAYTSSFVWVGYWPASIFNSLNYGANSLHWGGEVCGHTYPGATLPPMGSGQWAYSDYGWAAFANRIKIVGSNNELVDAPDQLATQETQPNCYTVVDKGNDIGNFGRYFYFGGPGGYCTNTYSALE
ncbi:protein neprosin-like [Aristolochia californica]|uniref:protein neprosin-like n=1 Tax=Aristolochia californica TaxID=171875 RepID=UPI0035DAE2C8